MGIVHTIHGPPFMPVEGGAVARLKVRVNNAIYTAAERFAARRCHRIVSVADAMTRQFLARGIGKAEQYATVYSGMEVERYLEPAPGQDRRAMRGLLGLAPDDIVIGTVARLAQHKGHDDVLDALAPDLRANPRLKLLWVGDGWWRERLLDKAFSLPLRVEERDRKLEGTRAAGTAQLILTGMVPPERVPGYLRAMDILVHPSYREGLPRTVPQALLCGVPPVAYDIDGAGEVCRDGETGRLVAAGDLDALRGAVLSLAGDAGLRERLAARGRAECAERFSAERMVDELERVYAQALGIGGEGGT